LISYKLFNNVYKFYSDFVSPASKVYGPTMTASTVCVYKDFQLLQKVLQTHGTF